MTPSPPTPPNVEPSAEAWAVAALTTHKHVWDKTWPSLDGTRRECTCGLVQENDGYGWRDLIGGRPA